MPISTNLILDRDCDGRRKTATLRERARKIVAKAGFAPWRALIDKAIGLIQLGHSERMCSAVLKGSTKRLPQ